MRLTRKRSLSREAAACGVAVALSGATSPLHRALGALLLAWNVGHPLGGGQGHPSILLNLDAHIIAISLDRYGYLIDLFTTNRWVSDEIWYAAGDVIALLDGSRSTRSFCPHPTNRWLRETIRLVQPQIEAPASA